MASRLGWCAQAAQHKAIRRRSRSDRWRREKSLIWRIGPPLKLGGKGVAQPCSSGLRLLSMLGTPESKTTVLCTARTNGETPPPVYTFRHCVCKAILGFEPLTLRAPVFRSQGLRSLEVARWLVVGQLGWRSGEFTSPCGGIKPPLRQNDPPLNGSIRCNGRPSWGML